MTSKITLPTLQKFLIGVLFLAAAQVSAQTIAVTDVVATPACAGNSVTVHFKATNGNGNSNKFTAGSLFTIYLSNSAGASYTPVTNFTASGVSFASSSGGATTLSHVITLPAGTPAGTGYRIRVNSTSPTQTTTTPSAAFTVNALAVSGTIVGGCTVCQGGDATLTLSGYTGNIQWQISTDNISFTNIQGATTATYNVQNVTSATYFRAVVTSGACPAAVSASVAVTTGGATTWDGTSWSSGAPTSVDKAYITGDYTSSLYGSITACTLSVSGNAKVVISTGNHATLNGALAVAGGSMFTLENNANLIQTSEAANSGEIIVNRKSSKLKRLDYTLWSSPVAGQNLLAFSPATQASRFYVYNTATNLYSSIAPSATAFETGKGYLIRMPNNHPTWAMQWNGQFRGVPHNGDYTVSLADAGQGNRFNLIGNPYPSPISVQDFVDANPNITGALYFWRKTNSAASPSYCSWKEGTFIANGEAQVFDLQGVIRTGQGFFVEGNGNGDSVVFNNAMRVNDNGNQFFRQAATAQKSRIWLNATNEAGAFSQMALVYVDDALTDAVDKYDARHINDGEIALNSTIDDVDYVIQGRAAFDAADVVPLRFKATDAGSYTIGIDHLDGLFAQGQPIYLRDNLSGALTDLNAGPYVFSCEAGAHAGRFDVLYQMPLATQNQSFGENQVVIYKQNGGFIINTGQVAIQSVEVFDIRGAQIASLKNVNASQASFEPGTANQVLIVKVTSDANQTVTKKVVN